MKLKGWLYWSMIALVLPAMQLAGCRDKGSNKTEAKTPADSIQNLIQELTEKINKQPGNTDYYRERALLYEKKGNLEMAAKDMFSLLKMDSSGYKDYNYLGDLTMKANAIKSSIYSYNRSIALNPKNDYAYLKLGELYLYLADYKESLKNLGKALENNKYNARTYFFIAYNYLELKDTNKALLNFQASVSADPAYYDSYMNLGLIYASRRNMLATKYYQNAMEMKPGSIEILYNLGKFYQDIDSFDRAIAYYLEILDKVEDHKSTSYNLGFIYLLKGDYNKSVQFFSTAVSKLPTYKEAYYGRGLAYLKLKKPDNARVDFEKVLELDPDDREAASELAKLK